MKKNYICLLLIIISIISLPLVVNASEEYVKCFYSILVPGKPAANTIDKNIEFVVKIGNSTNKKAECRVFFDDIGRYNDSINREHCTQSIDEKGNLTANPCGYYNCWNEKNGNNMNDRIRNGRYFYFHYGKEFYDYYYSHSQTCPELYGETEDTSDVYYVRMTQQSKNDYGPFKAKKKIVNNGNGPVDYPGDHEGSTNSVNYSCEYNLVSKDGYMIKMVLHKNIDGSYENYDVKITDSTNCDPKEFNSIQTMNNGNWQEYFASSFLTYSIHIPQDVFKKLVGSNCLNNNTIKASYSNKIVNISIQDNGNYNNNFNNFCVTPDNDSSTSPSQDNNANNKPTKYEIDYENLCSTDPYVQKAFRIISYVLTIIKWITPLIIIVLGMLDFSKAVTSQDEKAINKAANALIRRLIAGVAIIFIPAIILALIRVMKVSNGVESNNTFISCTECLLDVNSCKGTIIKSN